MSRINRLVAGAVVLVSMGSAAGCGASLGPNPAATATHEALQVVEAQAWPDGMGGWRYVVVVENPSDELAYFSEGFDIQAVTDDGTVLDSDTRYLTVLPGSRAALTSTFRNLDGLGAHHVTVTAPDTAEVVAPGSVGHFEVEGVAVSVDAEGNRAVVGSVVSRLAEEERSPSVVAVVRDSAGRIVDAVETTVADTVPAGGEAEFVAHLFLEPPADAVAEVYVSPSGLS